MDTYRSLDKRDNAQQEELSGGAITPIGTEALYEHLKRDGDSVRLDMSRLWICDADLSGKNLSNIDFSCTRFERTDLRNAFMDNVDVSRCFFVDCKMSGVRLTNSNASDASFRGLDLTGADFSGTDFYYAALEFSCLDDVITDENTKWFGDAVPKKGAFICWKVGADNRVIQLLVPAEAKRTCATSEAGRAEFAKVLSVTNADRTVDYTWASAMVDHDFIYEVGKIVRPDNGFSEYGWMDDSPGLHFFMDRGMAVAFGTGNY